MDENVRVFKPGDMYTAEDHSLDVSFEGDTPEAARRAIIAHASRHATEAAHKIGMAVQWLEVIDAAEASNWKSLVERVEQLAEVARRYK